MEMTREAAINALEHLIMSPVGREEIDETCYEVMEYLAQKNPRLLTISDFDNNPNADSRGFLPAWIEYRRDGDWFEYWNDIDDEWSPVNRYSFCGEGYRCWTSKPTDDQRKNTPWESD